VAAWEDLLGGTGNQTGSVDQFLLWGVAYGFASAILAPVFADIEQKTWEAAVNTGTVSVLTPATLADLVVKSIITQDSATTTAKQSGMSPDDFGSLVDATGEPPGLEFVLQAYRRGFIDFPDTGVQVPSVDRAIKTSRVYNYWSDVINKMLSVPLSPSAAVDAVLRNQISQAEGETIAYANGLDADNFQIALDTQGNPPSLSELLELMKRGFIPPGNLDPATKAPNPAEISFAQGIYEGNSKDKWLPYYAQLAEYIPPPRTVVALLRADAITPAQAAEYLEDAGLTPALADAYITEATTSKTAAAKTLSESAVVKLYTENLVSADVAIAHLEALGYDSADAGLIIATADAQATATALHANVTKIGGYYQAHKIDRATAQTLLNNLGVAPAQQNTLLAGWDIDRAGNVKILTPAQIAAAFENTVYTQAQAMIELEGLGYTPFDAWSLLSIAAKEPLPGQPAQGPPPVQ
jgi:hypothetical protein